MATHPKPQTDAFQAICEDVVRKYGLTAQDAPKIEQIVLYLLENVTQDPRAIRARMLAVPDILTRREFSDTTTGDVETALQV